MFVTVQKLSFGKIGFSKAMSNKWIRLDKAHEGSPRIFRSVCVKFYMKLLSWPSFSPCYKVCVCVVMCGSPGGEHRRPGQREAAPDKERQRDSGGGEGKE